MKTQWIKKNVDLRLLSKNIELFFVEKGFKLVKRSVCENNFSYRFSKNSLYIEINVFGNSDDFTVEFVRKPMEDFTKVGFITLPFGGGALFLKELKIKRRLEKLENEFWFYMENMVSNCKKRI